MTPPRPTWIPFRRGGCLAAIALTCTLAGCPSPDAEGKYNAFLDETEDEREDAANVKLDQGGALADVTGDFLFALAAVIDPAHPLQFFAHVTFTPTPEGGMLGMELQPLSLGPQMTTAPRQPVGDALVLPPTAVDASGGFAVMILEPVMVTGMANPITGSDIVATLNLMGAIQSEDLFCGTVSGAVTAPLMLDLAGSTFAAVRVPGIDMLPGDPITTACPMGGGMTSGDEMTGGESGDSGSTGG